MTSDVRKALKPYMEEKGYTTYDDYILDYYRKADRSAGVEPFRKEYAGQPLYRKQHR